MQRIRYTAKIAEVICERVASGQSLLAICSEPGMPPESTVRWWLSHAPAFAANYARARDAGLDAMAEETLRIADTPRMGTIVTEKSGPEGGVSMETKTVDMIEHRRLQVDTRKWYLSKLAPKRYGDRLGVDNRFVDSEGRDLIPATALQSRILELRKAIDEPEESGG